MADTMAYTVEHRMDTMTKYEPRLQSAAQRIARECLPQLLALQAELQASDHRVVGAVLPAQLDPGPYEGEDATDIPAQIMGLPVIWGNTLGLVVAADSHLARQADGSLRDFSPKA